MPFPEPAFIRLHPWLLFLAVTVAPLIAETTVPQALEKAESDLSAALTSLEGTREEIAAEKQHLTTRQAGSLAAAAGARQFTIFHFSPRYQDAEDLFYNEAKKAYLQNKSRD